MFTLIVLPNFKGTKDQKQLALIICICLDLIAFAHIILNTIFNSNNN